MALEYIKHPLLEAPDAEQQKHIAKNYGESYLKAHHALYHEKIRRADIDPLNNGFDTAGWIEADKALADGVKYLYIGGGNRAGKTRWCAKTIIKLALERPKTNYLCGHSSLTTSIQVQQPYLYEFLPEDLKNIKPSRHDRVTHLNYSQKNGFSDQTIILPNGSQIWFKNYTQDPKTLEGAEYDMVWLDELAPMSFVDTLPYRLVTRNGVFMLSVTPIEGFTKAVRFFLDNVNVIKWRDAVMLPDTVNVPGGLIGKAPFVADIKNGNGRAVWFHSDLNPFSDWHAMKRQVQGKSKEDIMMRVYGWVSNLNSSRFPKFGAAHIIDELPDASTCTHYMVMDPAGSRNWYALWAMVDDCGRIYVYREWPDAARYGDWAVEDKTKKDGKPGPAQTTGAGNSVSGYRKTFYDLENDQAIFERYIDPRAGKTAATALKERNQSLIDVLNESTDETPGMHFMPSVVSDIEEGINLVNSLLSYDESEPITTMNEPKLYIHKSCENLIWAMENWTGLDREKGACKDPIDALRYLVMMDPQHIDRHTFKTIGGGSY